MVDPVDLDNFFIAFFSAAMVIVIGAGYEQSFIERATGGSTWQAYFEAQMNPWFVQAMQWRIVLGIMTVAGVLLLVWDLLTIGSKEYRSALEIPAGDEGAIHGDTGNADDSLQAIKT